MFCVRGSVAAYVVVCLLALITYPTQGSGAEEKPKPQVLFTNVNIFDGKSDTLAEDVNVLVEGNLFKEIANGDIEARDGATVIDGGGRSTVPCLRIVNSSGRATWMYESIDIIRYLAEEFGRASGNEEAAT